MAQPDSSFDVIVIGGGAAGLLCAIEAGQRGRRVAVLEHSAAIGRKILISGGGRCNFTNLHCAPEHFLSANPHFHKSALARYRPKDFLALVEKHGIRWHEKTLGQLFCDRSARDITAMLEAECAAAGVRILTGAAPREVRKGTEFEIDMGSHSLRSSALVIATGGLSIPKAGASDFGYRVARQFGHSIEECRPALTPLKLAEADRKRYCDLAGVSASAIVSIGKRRFRENLLITHRGLSGPAILQISSYWKPGAEVLIDLLPEVDIAAVFRERKQRGDRATVRSVASEFLAQRLAARWCELRNETRALAAIPLRDLENIAAGFHNWKLRPSGVEDFEKAEVTAGGVDTRELSSKTMESTKLPGLFFIGEVVDVTGQLGGFNFQWAWASGYCAGQAL